MVRGPIDRRMRAGGGKGLQDRLEVFFDEHQSLRRKLFAGAGAVLAGTFAVACVTNAVQFDLSPPQQELVANGNGIWGDLYVDGVDMIGAGYSALICAELGSYVLAARRRDQELVEGRQQMKALFER